MFCRCLVLVLLILLVSCEEDFKSGNLGECHNNVGFKGNVEETSDEEVEIPDSDNEILGDESCLKIEVSEHSQDTISFNYDGLFDCVKDMEYRYSHTLDISNKTATIDITLIDPDPNKFSYCRCCRTMSVELLDNNHNLLEIEKVIIKIASDTQEYSLSAQ